MNIKKITSKLFIIGIGIGCVLSISYVIASYSEPTSSFPNGNTSAPIDVSSTDQVKSGGLTVNSLTIPTGAGSNKILTSDANGSASWQNGIPLYRCPYDPIATNYCANVQLLRNGIPPCMGQLSLNGGGGCYVVDKDCNFNPLAGIGSWGVCSNLVGYINRP